MKQIFIACLLLLSACSSDENSSYQGYIEGEYTYLSSPFAGELKKLYVKSGQFISKDAPLFKLNPNPESYQLLQAKNELASAQSELDDLQKPKRAPEQQQIIAQIEQAKERLELLAIRFKRYQYLYKKQAVHKDKLDEIETVMQQQTHLINGLKAKLQLAQLPARIDKIIEAKAAVGSKRAKLQEITWQVKEKTVAAPANGFIFDTYYHPGEYVLAAKPVVSLLSPKNISIIFFVPANKVNQLAIGQTILFSPKKKFFKAKITYISPQVVYAPPLVYNRKNNDKLVFEVNAQPLADYALALHPGAPITIQLLK